MLLAIAFLIMVVLAYLDEGIRNFTWTQDPQNWIALGFFTVLIFLGQLATLRFLSSRIHGGMRIFLAALGGVVLFAGVMVVYGLILMALH